MSDSAFSGSLSRRQLLALGGSAAAVGALAACGGNTGRDSGVATGSTTAGSGAKPDLAQWYHQYGEVGTQKAVEGYAKAYPYANVKVTWKPGDYDQTMAASLLTESGPDVFEFGNGPTIDMIKGKQVTDLTDLFGDTKDDFNPSVLKRMTYDGKIWAIPQVVDMQLLVYRKSLLLGAPKDWFDGAALAQGLTAMQFTGLWTFPDLSKGLGDDFGAIPWPASDGGAKSVPVGAYGSAVSTRSKNVDAAKKFAKWLWIEQTDKQLDFATAYGFHIPARKSLVSKAQTLKSGPAADAARYAVDHGHAQSPILWTPKSATAFGDMMSRIVKDGADPTPEIATVKAVVEAELKRVLG